MKTRMLFLLVLLSSASLWAQPIQGRLSDTKKTPEKVVQEVKKKDSYLIDVRTPEEYREGHLLYAQNIDYKSAAFKEELAKLDKRKPVYLYCRSGNRSGKAVDTLALLGFKEVYNIGGFELLKTDGLPASPASK